MLECCGSRRWATEMIALRPYINVMELRMAADRIWAAMEETDLLEAFASHQHIGELDAQPDNWPEHEQSATQVADSMLLAQLERGNAEYEKRFGFIYILCATEMSPMELLDTLNRRLHNSREVELREAAEQQRLITQLRISTWLDL